MILTDEKGHPIPRPERSDFEDDIEFIRAFYKWRDRVANLANEAFRRGLHDRRSEV